MEYLVLMTTRLPDRTPQQAIDDIQRPRGRTLTKTRRPRATCSACGARRHNQANGRPSDCSPPTTAISSGPSSPLCRCTPGVLIRSPRSPGTRTTRHSQASPGATEFLTTCTVTIPPGHARPDGRGHQGARGRTRVRAGRAGTPAAAVGAAGPGALAGPLASPGPGRDAGDPEIAPAGGLDDRADHAAHPAPQRPGGSHEPDQRHNRRKKESASDTAQHLQDPRRVHRENSSG